MLARVAEPRTSPEEFARIRAMPQGVERGRALNASVSVLVRADSSAAVRMVEALPPGQDRTEAAAAMVGEWARKDFAAALAWAEKQGDRQTVLWHAISSGADAHPKEAADAAGRVIGPKDEAPTRRSIPSRRRWRRRIPPQPRSSWTAFRRCRHDASPSRRKSLPGGGRRIPSRRSSGRSSCPRRSSRTPSAPSCRGGSSRRRGISLK
jgi:hypothetical protein